MMAGLQELRKLVISVRHILATREFLRTMGRNRLEGLIVWAGVLDADICRIQEVFAPKQHSYATSRGLLLSLDSESLHDLNVYLFTNGLRLIAQVHSHGEHAFHSKTDDEQSIVTALGGVSVVVRHFAEEDDMLAQCAVFRLREDGWHQLRRDQIDTLIEVID